MHRIARISVAAMLALGSGCSGSGDGASDEELEPTSTELGPEVSVTTGTRKVMLIVMNDCASCQLAQSPSAFNTKFAGPATPNVIDYYNVVSGGRFRFQNVQFGDVVNPRTAAFDTRAGVTSGQSAQEQAVRRAVLGMGDLLRSVGFSFFNYDTNGDGIISATELTLVVISNAVQGGKTIPLGALGCVTQADGWRVCSNAAYSGDREAMINVAHELGHTLGGYDIYGNWQSGVCHSRRASVMSCTGSTDEWYNFDPWHRRKLGWVQPGAWISPEPAVTTGTVTLVTPRTANSFSNLKEILSVKNPANPKESIDLERRSRSDNYDQNTVHSGVIAWYTLEHSNGLQLRQLPSLSPNAEGGDNGHFRLAPVGCVGSPLDPLSRGKANPLKSGSSYRFKWRDGTDTGWLFTIGPDSNGGTAVTISKNTTPPSCSNP
jgi:M6 family metalloprotease-like protein